MAEAPYELTISRYIDAPPAKVWQILTHRLEEWFCPKPWRAEIASLEWRAGGPCNITMHGPAGERMDNQGVMLEVTPGERFVFTDAFDSDWNPLGPFMVGIIAIHPEANGTRYTGSARHWTAEAYQQHQEMGFTTGWSAVADQVAELAEAN